MTDSPDTNFKIIDNRSPETQARVAGNFVSQGDYVQTSISPGTVIYAPDLKPGECRANWVEYDGSEGTLPDPLRFVFLNPNGFGKTLPVPAVYFNGQWEINMTKSTDIHPFFLARPPEHGDRWCYLPEAGEK